MEKLATLLSNLFNTFLGRIISSFGLGFVTITSYQQGLDWMKNGIRDVFYSVPYDIMNLIALSGITDGFGYFMGAAAFIISQSVINRLVAGIF